MNHFNQYYSAHPQKMKLAMEIAIACDVSINTIGNWRRGFWRPTHKWQEEKIAAITGIREAILFEQVEERRVIGFNSERS